MSQGSIQRSVIYEMSDMTAHILFLANICPIRTFLSYTTWHVTEKLSLQSADLVHTDITNHAMWLPSITEPVSSMYIEYTEVPSPKHKYQHDAIYSAVHT